KIKLVGKRAGKTLLYLQPIDGRKTVVITIFVLTAKKRDRLIQSRSGQSRRKNFSTFLSGW
ncbi:MAG: hypothetical protein K2X39_09825, partial [Silvanigrellaceae bacterium]|nr:hypothetical protein [Silvanigrellaceae bacterium]